MTYLYIALTVLFAMSLLFWKLSKTLLISAIVVVVLLLNYLFFAWLLSIIPTTTPPATKVGSHTLYISTNGVHVDVVLPVEHLPANWLSELAIPVESRYLGVGWGDRGFYLNTPTWAELDWKVAFSAAFLLSPTLMHVTHYRQPSQRWYSAQVNEEQWQALLAFVEDSFKRGDEAGLLLLEGKGYGARDFFYEAKGNYTAFYTCNVWTNQALKRAGVKTAIWAPFEWGIVRHLQRPEGHS